MIIIVHKGFSCYYFTGNFEKPGKFDYRAFPLYPYYIARTSFSGISCWLLVGIRLKRPKITNIQNVPYNMVNLINTMSENCKIGLVNDIP